MLMMALHFTLAAKHQVKIAEQFDDKLKAELALHSAESELYFALLTLAKSEGFRQTTEKDPIGKLWNFHGQPFSVNSNVTVQIQDVNGLLSLSAVQHRQLSKTVLLAIGIAPNELDKGLFKLTEWQSEAPKSDVSAKRFNFIPHLSELRYVFPMSDQQFELVSKVFSPFPATLFNPHQAPDLLLGLLYGKEKGAQLAQLRSEGKLSANRFIELSRTNDQDESLTFTVSDTFAVRLTSRFGAAVAEKYFICYIRDQSRVPINWIQ